VLGGMSSAGNSAGMAAYQHMPNTSGANSSSNMAAASAGMHGIGNSPGLSGYILHRAVPHWRGNKCIKELTEILRIKRR